LKPEFLTAARGALAGLATRPSGNADDKEIGQPRRDVHLHLHQRPLQAHQAHDSTFASIGLC
jgi:hypothetical protein